MQLVLIMESLSLFLCVLGWGSGGVVLILPLLKLEYDVKLFAFLALGFGMFLIIVIDFLQGIHQVQPCRIYEVQG